MTKLREYGDVECYNCDGDGGCEYSHFVDDLTVDGGQREVIEIKTCHICQGNGRLVNIPAPVADAYDAVIEAAHKATCAWPGSGALTMPALNKALDKLEQVRE